MKKQQQNNIQYAVISLLAMYLVIALLHVAFMPNINNMLGKLRSNLNTELIHKSNNSGTNAGMHQRGIRSVIEQKRKIIVPLSPAIELLFSFIFGGLAAFLLTQKPGLFFSPFQLLHPRAYLILRSLRI